MAITDMVVFNESMQTTATEVIGQQVELFNTATRGAITLRSFDPEGDFSSETMFKQISDLVKNRNMYGQADLTPVDLQQLEEISVKIAGGTDAVRYQPAQFDWINMNVEAAGIAFGEQVAKGVLQYMLNSAISATVGAISNVGATLTFTATAGEKASLENLNSGSALFGDRAPSIAAWVMHSKSLHDLYGAALTNTERLFEFGTVQVMSDGFGRPLIMTDSPALINTTPDPDKYYQLGLVNGGIILEDNGDYRAYQDQIVLRENVEEILKAEFSYNLGLKGYRWNTAAGGKSPNDTAIGTGTNWDKVATDIKDTAGVLVVTE